MKKGWDIKELGTVCDVQRGLTYSGKDAVDFSNIVVLRATNINLESSKIDLSELKYLRDDFEVKEKYRLKRGSLLICFSSGSKSHLGKVALIDSDCDASFGGFIGQITPNDLIASKYLFFNLLSERYRAYIAGLTDGIDINNLKTKDLKTFPIPIPPLSEQEEIVEVLDTAFAAIDQAKANIEQNIANAKELFQSKLIQIFSQKGEGWVETTLGEACVVERGSSPRPIQRFITEEEDGVNWIKIGDVNQADKYVRSTRQKITKKGAEKSRFVDVGDFILSNSMSFGRPYIMAIQGYIHDGWFVLRLPENINSDYFWQLLASPYLKEQFNNLAAGAIVKNISGDLVKKAIIPIPSLAEQRRIFLETETLKEAVDATVDLYQTKLNFLDELKKSILQKSFAGELT